MKIILAEELDGQQLIERAFERPIVKVGRSPQLCQMVFDQNKWPMVSRQHAEFHLESGRCLLVDKSSFGTYLDGQRITEPAEVRAGSKVQFGKNGPVLRVQQITLDSSHREESAVPAFDQTIPLNNFLKDQSLKTDAGGPPPASEPPPTKQRAAQPSTIELVDVMTGSPSLIQVSKDVLRFGRAPEMDVVINATTSAVSRRHAEVRRSDGKFMLVDLGSFNGTLLNGKRITEPTPLDNGALIQLGLGGPLLRFNNPAQAALADAQPTRQPLMFEQGMHAAAATPTPSGGLSGVIGMRTMVAPSGTGASPTQEHQAGIQQAAFLTRRLFEDKSRLTIGRAEDNDIRLDGLQISKHHARFLLNDGRIAIEDVGSTNGIYVNGQRITGKKLLEDEDVVQLGPFTLKSEGGLGVAVFDARSKFRIDAIDVTKVVPDGNGGGQLRLLDNVNLTIQPNEFVGLLGPSGAGKSTLMDSLNGMRPASGGHVLINNLDLYQHLDSLKQSIGYVPQDDIIHRELTVYRTLYYVARLRLSRDISVQEINQIVGEVLDVTGLAERRDVPVAQLSGGQRKRVSIAVELITKPSVIFLDEPTSGLDPSTEEKIMKLFRQIAESGRTVILTTHAMENVRLFDKIVVMMRGKLVFYGTPEEALVHFKADNFKDLYDKLEAPITELISKLPPLPSEAAREQKLEFKGRKEEISEQVAEDWKQNFQHTEIYQRNVVVPLKGLQPDAQQTAPTRRRSTVTDAVRQLGTLARRYLEVLGRDKLNLLILFGQAPLIALLTYLVVGSRAPRDFPYFMLALIAIWFGTSVSAREIIRERAVYSRERMINLGLLPYIGSKFFVLSSIVGLQCLLLYGTLKVFHYVGLMKLPGWAIPQLLVMILTGMVGIALGLFISSTVKTSEMATSLVPLILIPQILFCGLVGVPTGLSRIIGVAMPATWSFDEMKRLSTLDTLREEGSNPTGVNKGRGLYKHVTELNDQNITRARDDIDKYKTDAERAMQDFKSEMNEYVGKLKTGTKTVAPTEPQLGSPPTMPPAEKVPEDLSDYVDFLHPWGHTRLNPLVLLFMLFGYLSLTVLALRVRDKSNSSR
jgi:ABC-type multidrug transport system ATPase subunit/pSer/pThr/pTyr-binding forkhead associated (FHA) protein